MVTAMAPSTTSARSSRRRVGPARAASVAHTENARASALKTRATGRWLDAAAVRLAVGVNGRNQIPAPPREGATPGPAPPPEPAPPAPPPAEPAGRADADRLGGGGAVAVGGPPHDQRLTVGDVGRRAVVGLGDGGLVVQLHGHGRAVRRLQGHLV